jgi:nitrate reductase NapD
MKRIYTQSAASGAIPDDDRAEDLHIAGVLVHARIDVLQHVRGEISAFTGAVVHGADADGRIVVTIEGASSRALLDTMDMMSALPGVMSAALVYQHNESLQAMQQEMA